MYHEGDIKPAVKRVRPYKTLLINLPPKSFGFWVLANTNIEACQYSEGNNDTSEQSSRHVSEEESEEVIRRKRLVEVDRCQDNKSQNNDKQTDINIRSNTVSRFEINRACDTTTSYTQSLDNYVLNLNSVKSVLMNKTNNGEQKEIKPSINTDVADEILDLDNATEVQIIKVNNESKEQYSNSYDNLAITQKSLLNSNLKTKRNVENQEEIKTNADSAGSSSVTHSTRKTKRPDDRSKRRQSINASKSKRFENLKTSKLRKSEDNEPNKLERLKAKLFKNKLLEGRGSILDNILSKRNSRLKGERRKLRFGQNNLNKRNSRTTKRRDSSKNGFNEEKTTRFRRSIKENISEQKELMLANFNGNKTMDTLSRTIRNTNIENKIQKSYRKKLVPADENIYTTSLNPNNPTDIRIKTLTDSRNLNEFKNQILNENHTESAEIEIETGSNEKDVTKERFRNEKSEANYNKADAKTFSLRKKNIRSSRNANEKVKKIPLDVSENEIEHDDIENTKLWKILRKIHKQLKDLSSERDTDYDANIGDITIDDYDQSTKEDNGLIKSTINNLLKVLRELNKNLNRFWSGVNLLD